MNPLLTATPDIPVGARGLLALEREDPELVAIAQCMTALRDLNVEAAARVASYVAERHPFYAMSTASAPKET